MKANEIILPDGWEVKEVQGNKIIIGEADKKGLPRTWEECAVILNNLDDSVIRLGEDEYRIIPNGFSGPLFSLCKLIICRNTWWNQLGWKPDWKNCSTVKHCIQPFSEKIDKSTNRTGSVVLAFPTIEIRDQFLETFRDLIEEAKELL